MRLKVAGGFAVTVLVFLSATSASEAEDAAGFGVLAVKEVLVDADGVAAEGLTTDGFVSDEAGMIFVEEAETEGPVGAAGDCAADTEGDGLDETAVWGADSW
jgi:hypothetical protein